MAKANEKEIVVLKALRERARDLNLDSYQQLDEYLLRWLRARDLNVDKALDMLRKHLIWRKTSDIDRIFTWKPPDFIQREFPFKVSGYDEEGCPILIACVGRWNVPAIVEMKIKGEYQRYIDQIMEIALAIVRQRRRNNKKVTQFIGIADLEGLTYRQFASKEIIELSIEALKRVEANHPEVLKYAFGINAPKIFTVFYAILKPFFSEYTQSKIQLFGSNSEQWRNYLRSKIPADQLPSEYGGSNTTVKNYELKDGFENLQQTFGDFPEEELVATNIDAGQKFQVELDIKAVNSVLSWVFRTTDFDIGFLVISKSNNDDKEKELVSIKRADAHINTQRGSIVCQTVGKYFLIFDNSYSRYRAKELEYLVSVKTSAN